MQTVRYQVGFQYVPEIDGDIAELIEQASKIDPVARGNRGRYVLEAVKDRLMRDAMARDLSNDNI